MYKGQIKYHLNNENAKQIIKEIKNSDITDGAERLDNIIEKLLEKNVKPGTTHARERQRTIDKIDE